MFNYEGKRNSKQACLEYLNVRSINANSDIEAVINDCAVSRDVQRKSYIFEVMR